MIGYQTQSMCISVNVQGVVYLEGNHSDGAAGEHDQRKGVLAAGHARVEVSDAGNHEPDKGSGGQGPGNVTGIER